MHSLANIQGCSILKLTRITIGIRNLRLQTTLGVYEKERIHDRLVVVNIRIDVDPSCDGESDSLDAAVNYSTIRDRLVEVAQESKAYLLENLAGRMLGAIIADERIVAVHLTVDKPGALRMAESVSVTMEWDRRSQSTPPIGTTAAGMRALGVGR